jgi:Rha family phage regulatory protein
VEYPIVELGVFEKDGKCVVSSRIVATVFAKEHKRVLQDVRDLNVPDEFRLHNFVQSSYENAQKHETPEFLLTRDGFTLLAMGYNGERAMRLKLAYIAAFNSMEEELRKRKEPQAASIENMLADPRAFIALAAAYADAKEEKERLEARPKVSYRDFVASCGDNRENEAVAGDYGMPTRDFIRKLHELEVMIWPWELYSKHDGKGYARNAYHIFTDDRGEERCEKFSVWTREGCLFLYELFKENGILPLIERDSAEAL